MEEDTEATRRLKSFLETGVYVFQCPNVVFMDPVRVLNRSYTRFKVSPFAYYPRFFDSKPPAAEGTEPAFNPKKRKRKAKEKKPTALNKAELAADQRHQQVSPLLSKAHEYLKGATGLLAVMRALRNDTVGCSKELEGMSFIELGRVWQAPLYEIAVHIHPPQKEPNGDEGGWRRVLPLFNNLVGNETGEDLEAEFLGRKYVMPRESCFYMSDLSQIHGIVPAESDCGFNLIMIDPPWENASARQKFMYPMLPNRYFLSLPVKELTHTDGALVALWVTNREKLRNFVEKELFPTWGVSYAASFYWLKVKSDGSLISNLDLFHHRPYECLLLGYSYRKGMNLKQMSSKAIKDDKIIVSIPGDYSRKPPVGELLLEHVPGCKPARCLELFAREMIAGWTSWGNEALHFQESNCFLRDEMDDRSV